MSGLKTGPPVKDTHQQINQWAYRTARLLWILLFGMTLLLFLGLLRANYRITFFSESVELSLDLLQYGVSRRFFTSYLYILRLSVVAIFILAAAIIFLRRVWPRKKRDWVAWLVSLTLLLLVVIFTDEVPQYSLAPVLVNIFSTLQGLLFFLLVAGIFNTLYLFPDGRIVPTYMRKPILLLNAMFLITFLAAGLVEGALYEGNSSDIFWGFMLTVTGTSLLLGVASQIYRYFRVSSALQRQQTKWVLIAILLQIFGGLGSLLPQGSENQLLERLSAVIVLHSQILLPALIPLAFLVAMLRYHLFDIDLIVRRTLVYGTLIGLLSLLFLVLVTALQSLFVLVSRQQSALSIVLSTLVITALFNPLRLRIKAAIDRRFYRRVYNAEQAISAFSAQVRDETDLRALSKMLSKTVTQTMQPESLSLWLAKEGDQLTPTPPGDFRGSS